MLNIRKSIRSILTADEAVGHFWQLLLQQTRTGYSNLSPLKDFDGVRV